MSNTANILGIEILRDGKAAVRSEIISSLKREGPTFIYTPNATMIALAERDPSFKELLTSASLLLPDGIGVVIASRILRVPIKERVTGIDTARWLLDVCVDRGLSVAFVGGKSGVSERAAVMLKKELPRLRIVFTHHGYFTRAPRSAPENLGVIENIRAAAPDVLFVCLGAPEQERWIRDSAPQLPSVKLFMGIGGALDVWSGQVRRAPRAAQVLCLEWLWRCIAEPKRFSRLLPLPALYFKMIFKK